MNRWAKWLLMFSGVLVLAGCATTYPVRVNGYLDLKYANLAPIAGSTFFVKPDPNAKNQILESQIKAKVEKLLVQNGYALTTSDKASYSVSFDYSINRGRMVMEERPEFRSGDVVPIYTRTSTGETQTSYVSFPGYTAYVPYWYRVYTATFSIKVMDASLQRSDNAEHQVWIGEARTSSSEADLQGLLDYLLAGVFQYFGKDTGQAALIDINKDNPALKSIRP